MIRLKSKPSSELSVTTAVHEYIAMKARRTINALISFNWRADEAVIDLATFQFHLLERQHSQGQLNYRRRIIKEAARNLLIGFIHSLNYNYVV